MGRQFLGCFVDESGSSRSICGPEKPISIFKKTIRPMRFFTRFLIFGAFWLAFSPFLAAQYNSPTLDGIISANEYGVHTNGINQQVSSTVTWFMTWDATNLYFAASGYTDPDNALNIYLDVNPAVVVNGGAGSTTGTTYDNATPALPFSGEWFFYAKGNGYEDVVQFTGGSWVNQPGLVVDKFYSANDNTLECRVTWATIGGMPAAMNWLGTLSYAGGGGGTFSPVPTTNPSGGGGPANVRYYTVANLADGTVFHPFTKESYTHTGASVVDFGAISVWDFTMNTPAASITRLATGAWTIENRLTINQGTVNFGACNADCSAGNSVHINTSGSLALSSASGGDLTLNGVSTELKIDGTFTGNNRAVNFLGGGELCYLRGAAASVVIDYLKIDLLDKLIAERNLTIDNDLNFINNCLDISTFTLTMNPGATFTCPANICDLTHAVWLAAGGHIKKHVAAIGPFGVPVNSAFYGEFTPAAFLVNSLTGSGFLDFSATPLKHPLNGSANHFINLYWTVNKDATITAINYDAHLAYANGSIVGSEASMTGAKTTNGGWQNLGPVNTFFNTIEGIGLTLFSDFTTGQATVLPLEWRTFSAEKMGDQTALLRWSVASQTGNRLFEMERSGDGGDWLKIGERTGDLNFSGEKTFDFEDRKPLAGLNFYRIRQVDLDGKSTVSAVRLLDFLNENRGASMVIFPNPTAGEASILFNMEESAAAEIRLFDALGSLVFSQKIGLEKGENRLNLSLEKLAGGIYQCLLLGETGQILGQNELLID